MLLAGGVPASIYYTASCGGRSEIPSAVWPGADDPPFLPSQPDAACGGAPEWGTELTDAELLRALHAAGFTGGHLRAMRIVSRVPDGWYVRYKRTESVCVPALPGPKRTVIGALSPGTSLLLFDASP